MGPRLAEGRREGAIIEVAAPLWGSNSIEDVCWPGLRQGLLPGAGFHRQGVCGEAPCEVGSGPHKVSESVATWYELF